MAYTTLFDTLFDRFTLFVYDPFVYPTDVYGKLSVTQSVSFSYCVKFKIDWFAFARTSKSYCLRGGRRPSHTLTARYPN